MKKSKSFVCMLIAVTVAFLLFAAPALSGTPKDTVVIAMGGDYYDGIDPARSGFWLSNEFQMLVHERVVDYAHKTLPDGSKEADPFKPIGALAKSIELSNDQKSYTFHLQRDRKFSNGNPVTAQAIKYSYARTFNIPGTTKFALTKMLRITKPEQMVVIDDYTLRVDLESSNPIFLLTQNLNNFGIINPKEAEAHKTEKDPYAQEWLKVNSTGSGPYMLEVWKPGEELSFKANPNYWGGTPAIARVIYKVVPSEQDRLLLLKNGDVDVAYNISKRNIVSLKSEKGITVLSFQTVGKEFLFLNPNLKPFTDKRVRQAVNYAINKQNIIDNVFMGLAIPLTSALPKGMKFHIDKPRYKYNPEKAKALLAEAGFPNGFTVDLAYRIGYTVHEEAAVYVQADLAKVGIKANVVKLAPATFTERMRKNQLPFGFSHFIPYVNHPTYHTYWQYHGESGYNYPRYNNPRVNDLITKVQSEMDPDRLREYFTEIQDIVYDDCPEVILVQYFFNVVMRDNLKGYVFYPDRISRWNLMHKE